MSDYPSMWIVGHYREDNGRLGLASARVGHHDRAPEAYQAALDDAQAELPTGMLGCTHKVVARSGAQAIERFRDMAEYVCDRESHGRPAGRIVPSV